MDVRLVHQVQRLTEVGSLMLVVMKLNGEIP